MKRLLLVFAAAGLLLATPSCKKGANDPFLSLKGRKARLAGEYEIASWSTQSSWSDSDGYTEVSTTDIEDGSGETRNTYNGPGMDPYTQIKNVKVNNADFVFDKDGTWSRTFDATMTWRETGDGFFVDYVDYKEVTTLKESGSWSFLGGESEDYKNKERILLSVLMSSDSRKTDSETVYPDESSDATEGVLYSDKIEYGEGVNSIIYAIDMLKNKEMVFLQESSMSDDYTSNNDGDIYTYTMTNLDEIEIVFVQD